MDVLHPPLLALKVHTIGTTTTRRPASRKACGIVVQGQEIFAPGEFRADVDGPPLAGIVAHHDHLEASEVLATDLQGQVVKIAAAVGIRS